MLILAVQLTPYLVIRVEAVFLKLLKQVLLIKATSVLMVQYQMLYGHGINLFRMVYVLRVSMITTITIMVLQGYSG